MSQHSITILGATGTIGLNTLDVISRHEDKFSVHALTANSNAQKLLELCIKFKPAYAVLLDEKASKDFQIGLKDSGLSTKFIFGIEGLIQVASAPEVDVVMAAIVGAAGLRPSLAAANAGKKILLANKETLVMSGGLFMNAVHQGGATLLPIDSEHNAIFQVMPSLNNGSLSSYGIRRILLTASGGPFRNTPKDDLHAVTLSQALKHPNWVMGKKITIDSATLMNKGLEVIEAHWLFNAMPEEIKVVVHPQSVIHSMVEYIDGSILAQLGNPDMRTPIAYALGFPERIESGVGSLDLFEIARLDFEKPDITKFPCLRLAYDALKMGGIAPAVLNAANEIAVEAFINGEIGFMDIPRVIEFTLEVTGHEEVTGLEMLLGTDANARQIARSLIEKIEC